MPGPRLTPAERDDVIRRYEAGSGLRAIATAIGRSYGSAHRVIAAAGIMRPRGGPRTRKARTETSQ